MRKIALLGFGALVSAAALIAAVALGSTIASDGRSGAPALRIVRSAPLTVKGQHFRSREKVRVTVAAKVTRTKANNEGMFVVVIRGADRCSDVRVLARGSAGSYATVKVLPSPACLPARSG
jgi:hypothetical protein